MFSIMLVLLCSFWEIDVIRHKKWYKAEIVNNIYEGHKIFSKDIRLPLFVILFHMFLIGLSIQKLIIDDRKKFLCKRRIVSNNFNRPYKICQKIKNQKIQTINFYLPFLFLHLSWTSLNNKLRLIFEDKWHYKKRK